MWRDKKGKKFESLNEWLNVIFNFNIYKKNRLEEEKKECV
jgi:hypothetical protein